MWFWPGTEVDPSQITDVPQYSPETSVMWLLVSLWYFAAGLAEIWGTILAVILLILRCTAGIALLVCSYYRTYKKYHVQ